MKLEVREVVGGSTEIVDVEWDGGEGAPLIVARTYEPEATTLLLAAPGLLAACKDLLELVERSGDYLDGWQNSGQPVPKARAAIAKAEGRT